MRSRVGGRPGDKGGFAENRLTLQELKGAFGQEKPRRSLTGSSQGKGKFLSPQMRGRPPKTLARHRGTEKGKARHTRARPLLLSPLLWFKGGGGAVTHCFPIPTDAQKLPSETLDFLLHQPDLFSAGEHLTERASLSDFIYQYKQSGGRATDELSIPTEQCAHTHTCQKHKCKRKRETPSHTATPISGKVVFSCVLSSQWPRRESMRTC